MATKFVELVGERFKKCKEVGLTYLQVKVITMSAMSRSRDAAGTTKKETVMLPMFSGDKKTAYLKYLVWRKKWVSHIVDYEEKYRATMLLNYLDSKALEKVIGLENDYNRAMAALDRYYNNCSKIIAA